MASDARSDEWNDEAACSSEASSDFVWSSLPEELLHQVLHRLPIHGVMKFRCVCKQWNELLMSSTFSLLFHHKVGKVIPLYLDERTITVYRTTTQSWLSQDLESSLAKVPFLEGEGTNFLDLVASGGGLLSFMARKVTELEFLIYNPLTEKAQRLQPIQKLENGEPFELILSSDTVMSKYLLYGIYVDFETGYYNFVTVDPGSLNHESTTVIYDSRLRSWKLGRKVPMSIIQLHSYSPLRVNCSIGCKSQCVTSRGKMYWMAEHNDGSDSVFIYDIKLDRWSYVKCIIPNDRVVFVRLLEQNNKVLLVGKRGARIALDTFCYFEIVELPGSSSTALSSLPRTIPTPSFVEDESWELHLRERVTPFEMVFMTLDSVHIDGSRRRGARPSWCVGGGKEVYFLLESRLFDAVPSGAPGARFTSPMLFYSGADNSWTWLTNWKIREDGSGILKPSASNSFWAFQSSLIHP